MVYLPPRSTATIYGIFKTDEGPHDHYIYTFPVAISTELGIRAENEFVVKGFDNIFDENYFKRIKKQNGDDFEEEFLLDIPDFSLSCQTNKDELYPQEVASVSCNIEHGQEEKIFNVCLDGVCHTTINRTQFNVTLQELGITTKEIRAESDGKSASDFVTLNLIEPEKIELVNVTYPDAVDFDDTVEVCFVLHNARNSVPKNITASLSHEFFKQVWRLPELENEQGYVLRFKASDLKPKNNLFKINVRYMTKEGNYKIEKLEFPMEIKNMSFGQMFSLWMNYISNRLEKQTMVQVQDIDTNME
jgi:hypothetical protein